MFPSVHMLYFIFIQNLLDSLGDMRINNDSYFVITHMNVSLG